MRQVKPVIEMSDIICKNCVWHNGGDCIVGLPMNSVEPDNRCCEGQWLYKDNITSFENICIDLEYHKVIETIEDIKCGNCLHYYPTREECHCLKDAYYRTQSDDWCAYGNWLYLDPNDNKVDSNDADYLYYFFNYQSAITEEETGESNAD